MALIQHSITSIFLSASMFYLKLTNNFCWKLLKISGALNSCLIWNLNSTPRPWGLGGHPSIKNLINIQILTFDLLFVLYIWARVVTTPSYSYQSIRQCAVGLKGYGPVGEPANQKIDYKWLNLSMTSFKIKCKNLYLTNNLFGNLTQSILNAKN